MDVALKEWSAVVEALGRGLQIMLLRKGGIVEARRHGFELRHTRFLLFPTFEHQSNRLVRPEFRHLTEIPDNPGVIPIRYFGQAETILPAPANADHLLAASENFIWTDEFIRMRYGYRPDLPLYILLLRLYRLPEPVLLLDRPSYAGCKSWVNLTEEIDTRLAESVLTDHDFSRLSLKIRTAIEL